MGTIIKDVAFLDLTDATEAALKEIKAIHGIAFLLYNERFERFMPKVTLSDIAFSMSVEDSYKFTNGQFQFDGSYASGISEPVSLLVNGRFIVKPDVTAEMIDQALNGLIVNGQIICPKSLQGALHQKIKHHNGKLSAYLDDAHLETGELTIDEDYLKQLKPGTNLVTMRKAKMVKDVDTSLLEEKINQIQFLKGSVLSESNKQSLSSKIVQSEDVVVIPQGFTYINGDLELDADALTRYKLAKLYVSGTVIFQQDVAIEDVEQHISEIQAEGIVYCKSRVKAAVRNICEPTVRVVSYSGALRFVEGEYRLMKAELEYSDAPLTLLIKGVVDVNPDVEPQLLYDKIERIDLYGVLEGNADQCGVLQTKIRTHKGVVSDRNDDFDLSGGENSDGEDTVISSVAHLRL